MKLETAGSIPIVKRITNIPTNILSCIPTTNIFICGAILASMARIQLRRSVVANTGSAILKPITK